MSGGRAWPTERGPGDFIIADPVRLEGLSAIARSGSSTAPVALQAIADHFTALAALLELRLVHADWLERRGDAT